MVMVVWKVFVSMYSSMESTIQSDVICDATMSRAGWIECSEPFRSVALRSGGADSEPVVQSSAS